MTETIPVILAWNCIPGDTFANLLDQLDNLSVRVTHKTRSACSKTTRNGQSFGKYARTVRDLVEMIEG